MATARGKMFGAARLLSALVLVTGIAAVGGCGADETFTVNNPGDRQEVNLGTAGPGKFHFEAKGFIDEFISDGQGKTEYIYFYLYSGNNFYYKGAGEGFLYIPYEYRRNDYSCNYGKVKGRSDYPGEWEIEDCYMDQAWDSSKWYSFDIEWDGSNISISIDGALKHTGSYGSNDLTLIAGMGWPPDNRTGDALNHDGIIGMEFRNWSFTKK